MLRVSRKTKLLCLQDADSDEAHMAEELRNASYVLPRILFWVPIVNGFLAFLMLITFCYCIGDEAAGECFHQRITKGLELRYL
jgi:choline transport protein